MTQRFAARFQSSVLVLAGALVFSQPTIAQDKADVRLPQAKPGSETVEPAAIDQESTTQESEPNAASASSSPVPAASPEQSGLVPRPRPGEAEDQSSDEADAGAIPIQKPGADSDKEPDEKVADKSAPDIAGASAKVENPDGDKKAPKNVVGELTDAGSIPRPRPDADGIGGAGEVDAEGNEAAEAVIIVAPPEEPAKPVIELTAAPADGEEPVNEAVEPVEPVEPAETTEQADETGEIVALLPVPRPDLKTSDGEDAGPVDDHVLAALTPEEAREEIDCKWRLKSLGAAFEELDPMDGEGACGIKAPILVTELATNVRLNPEAILNCRTAYGLARWVADTVTPQAEEHLENKFTGIRHGSTYVCRNRNNQSDAKLSEHATGNAVDIVSIEVEGGPPIAIVDRSEEETPVREFQKAIRSGACEQFTTVLGPGTNAFHSTHFHFDMAQRNGGYRLCE